MATSSFAPNATAAQTALLSHLLSLSPELSPISPFGSRTSSFIAGALASLASAAEPSATELTRKLLVGVSTDMIPWETPAVFETSAFDADVRVLPSASSVAATTSSVNVTTPDRLDSGASGARLLVVSWKPGLPADAPMPNSGEGDALASDVEDVTLTDATGKAIPIPEEESIRIEIPLNHETAGTSDSLRCVYIEKANGAGEWSEDGCSIDIQGTSAACVCTHLTEFAVMRRAKRGEGMPESLRWSYVAGAVLAWGVGVIAFVQSMRIVRAGKYRGWVGMVHIFLVCQG
eukprot:1394729-Amorphochlora_amoeboformis.AAC.1